MPKKKSMRIIIASIAVAVLALCLAFFPLRPHEKQSDAGDEILVYSPHPQEMTEYITREFRQRTGIRVKIVYGGTGDLIERLKRHDEVPGPDILWGGGVESLETIKSRFREYSSVEDKAILDVYKSPSARWHPFSVLPVVIIYNTKLVPKKHIPSSWSSLLDPYFHDRIIMADPATSGSSYTILVTMLRTMPAKTAADSLAWPYVEGLISQIGPGGLVPGSSTAYNAVAAGEFFASITFENSALSLMKAGRAVSYCYPLEGTSAVPDGIALLEGSQNPIKAGRFIDFVLSRDVQSILMSRWFRRSVRKDIPAYQPDLDDLRVIDYPIEASASIRPVILSRWAEAYSNARPGNPSASSR
jgi:iron(III) transport system substrate-binding protein